MSAPFVIPFNFCPTSTSLKTAAYTIPAGKYAYVKTSSPLFSINGLNFYPAQSISLSTTVSNVIGTATDSTGLSYNLPIYVSSGSQTRSGTTSGTTTFSLQIGYSASYQETVSSVSRTTNGTSSIAAAEINTTTSWFVASVQTTNSIGAVTISATATFFYCPNGSATDFWVPSGTVLDGFNFFVTEYNQIS